MAMRIDILTALPGIVEAPLQHSIIGRAQKRGLIAIVVHDLRTYGLGKYRQIDDYPFGGGAGMVLKPEPIFSCVEAIQDKAKQDNKGIDEIIFLTPDGALLDQQIANEISLKNHIVLIAGHYKGVDQRVRDSIVTRELSIGNYVLSGGELPALVLVDALTRLIPGVLNDAVSALSDSFQDSLLDAPVYTRPADFRGMMVPEVLLSGDHSRVEAWREEQRIKNTRLKRPNLMDDSSF